MCYGYCLSALVCILTLFSLPVAAAVIVVDAGGGGDYTNLADAVAAAVNGDVIQIEPGVYPTSILIEKSLTILGLGDADDVVLDGQDQRILLLQGEEEVVLQNLTLRNGAADSGGAVFSWQGMDLLVEDCQFIDNRTTYGGGAIEARSATGSLVLRRCLFEDNYAAHHAGGVAVMFGIDCEVDECRFYLNRAGEMAGGFTANQAGHVDIHHSVFGMNSGAEMGAIYVVFCNDNTIRNCTVWGTVAGGHAAILVHDGVLDLHHTIVGATAIGAGVERFDGGWLNSSCNIYWDNDLGDIIGGSLGEDEWHEDPQLCDPLGFDFAPCDESFAVVGTDCGLIGALTGNCPCGPVRAEPMAWGAVKALFR